MEHDPALIILFLLPTALCLVLLGVARKNQYKLNEAIQKRIEKQKKQNIINK